VTLTLLHNPHCPTSVHALDALEDAGREVAVRAMIGRPRSRAAAWAAAGRVAE
jgi:arsenate reductase-like glutaredoxin family protein